MAGSCDIYPSPEYVVLGKTAWDQDRIDEYVAVGSEVCNKPRPQARPASFDAPVSPPQVKAPPQAKRKPGVVRRIIQRVSRTAPAPLPTARPVQTADPPPAEPDPPEPTPPAPVPTPAPRDPLDELLNPK